MAEANRAGKNDNRRADLAFVDGPVATMDSVRSFTDAVAVRDGRIVALGGAAVHELIAPATVVVELRGRLLLPGFHDAHVHPVYGGIERLRCDLSGSRDIPDCLRRVGEYARSLPAQHWILGGGWETGQFPDGSPTRGQLDAVTGDRPAYLINRDHHGVWVNTAALRRAGIDRDTPDSGDGRIDREPDGHPSGALHEGATELLAHVLPRTTEYEYEQGLLEGQRYLHSCGVTAWHDAIIGAYSGYGDLLDTYVDLDRRGLLTGRVRGALWWDRSRDHTQIPDLLHRRARSAGNRFRADAVKIMQDGMCENCTAAMVLPYLGGHDSGTSYVDPETLVRAVRGLDAAEFQLHFHAIGDRAIRDVLDALALARELNGMNDLRHQIAHVQVVQPSDIPRFRELGVAATIQALWAVNDLDMRKLTVPRLGYRRAQWQFPFRSLREAGAVLAGGSDWPVTDANPIQAVHAAVNRSIPDDDNEPFLPAESIALIDAFAAHTTASAWVNHLDGETGSIELGKAADLAVLDRNPFESPAAEIGRASVDLTIVDGNIVHARH